MKETKCRQSIETRAIHAGQQPDPTTGAIMTPIYATSTYVQESPGVHKGFEYSRTHNPTRFALEDCVADLENGQKGFAFASGLACMGTILELLDSGDHLIAIDDLYGGSYRLFENVRKRTAGLEFSFVDLSDSSRLESEKMTNGGSDSLALSDFLSPRSSSRRGSSSAAPDDAGSTVRTRMPLSL